MTQFGEKIKQLQDKARAKAAEVKISSVTLEERVNALEDALIEIVALVVTQDG